VFLFFLPTSGDIAMQSLILSNFTLRNVIIVIVVVVDIVWLSVTRGARDRDQVSDSFGSYVWSGWHAHTHTHTHRFSRTRARTFFFIYLVGN